MTANVDIYVDRFAAHEKRLDAVEEHQRTMAKREIVQFVIGVLVSIGSIFGAGGFLSWQNAKLIEQFDKRIDQIEKRIDQNERNFNARIDALEKSTNVRIEDLHRDLTSRFDDLKQVVLSQKR